MTDVEPIAIVGIACRLPGGVRSADDLWNLLVGGVDAISEVPEERWVPNSVYHSNPSKPGRMNSRWGGFLDHIDRFDAQFFGVSPREAEFVDPQHRLLLEVAYHAVEDAGLTMTSLAGKRASVYVGISTWDYSFLQLVSEERAGLDAYTNIGTSLCIAANRISYFFNLVGPSLAVDTACSSSLVATHLACQSLWNAETELAFVGGVNVTLRPELTIGFAKASMLSPDGRCKSFDAGANGYVRSEGAGVVILKPLARALADGDHIHALIRGTSVNQDGRTAGISVPNGAAQEANINHALRSADIAPASVQYVEAHGTGTPVGDPIEAAAIGKVYGKARKAEDRCVIGSIKSNVGHLEAGAGITGLIKTALCLQHRQIPASLHFETPNPQIPFDDLGLRVAERLAPWPPTHGKPARAAVNSFGFGGTNGHAILEEAPEPAVPANMHSERDEGRAWMLPLSARSAPALADLARSYLEGLRHDLRNASLRDICFSASTKRSHHEFRLALVAHDGNELAEQLEAFLQDENCPNSSRGRATTISSKPVFVCSGMGQQWWAMGRQLLEQEPVYRQAIEEVSDLFGRLAGWSLLDRLQDNEQVSQIQRTDIGQPAIFALQVGLAALWRSWGIEPAAAIGHSAGEMAATYICGALSLEDAVRVTFHRSRLQHRTAGQGAMLAVGISRPEAAKIVERHPHEISIAAINGTSSVTLSGDAAVLANIDKALNEAGVFSRSLQVEVPFHSPQMEQLEAELIECLRDIQPRTASIPFFSTVTGTALQGTEVDAQYWYRNIRQPVFFHDAIGNAIAAGHSVFLEIGAHPILRRDIAQCLNETAAGGATLGSLRRDDRERAALLGSLGQLYALGAGIEWHKIYPSPARAIKLPSYPFQGDIHWRESERTRLLRVGRSVHPLLGSRLETSTPSWKVDLNSTDLSYLADHRIGGSIVFPGAGYVEMALAAARETFGPVPCVVEDIEFLKFLVLDQDVAPAVQIGFDAVSNEFDVHVRPDASDNSWDAHAHGHVRRAANGAAPVKVDIEQIRRRCPESFDGEECNRRFADCGYLYGPTFQGIAYLWRNEREILAKIHAHSSLHEHLADYRLHPAFFDACIQTLLAALPNWTNWQGVIDETYVPVKIGRLRFHASPPAHAFAHTRLIKFNSTELTVDVQILDEAGNCFVEVQGLTTRPTGYRAQRAASTLYEYQWQPAPRTTARGPRDASHLPPPEVLGPPLDEVSRGLQQRFDRVRFHNDYRASSRATAATYLVRALRELGWSIESFSDTPIETVVERLGMAPHYDRWLGYVLEQLSAAEVASTETPETLWKALWDAYPECHVETRLLRQCGEQLAAVLRGEVDPASVLHSGAMATIDNLYQDSASLRPSNFLVQEALSGIARSLPNGKALRILEIGGGSGGTTGFVLPVLPAHCTSYLFTDASPQAVARAEHKFARYPFAQFRTLDIEHDPIAQGLEAHSFDVVIATDAVHATKDLRQTLGHITRLLGSGGTLVLLEMTRPWLMAALTLGLTKDWWNFDDVRSHGPCLSQDKWDSLLSESEFSSTRCLTDCAQPANAQHSVIIARGSQLPASPPLAPQAFEEPRTWLVFVDDGIFDDASAGAELVSQLRQSGERVIEVNHRSEFRRLDRDRFSLRAADPHDMRHLLQAVRDEARSLAGVAYLWSLDTQTTEAMSSEEIRASAQLGCVGALGLVQALAATEGLAVDGIWLVTRATQSIEGRDAPLQVMQSPLWGIGRVAAAEYRNMRYRLVDLTTGAPAEIASLIEEMKAGDPAEDEIALYGELRHVHRLLPVSSVTVHGIEPPATARSKRFRIEVARPGILDSLSARGVLPRPLAPHEIEVEIEAAALNFKDVMMAMGLLPKDAIPDDSGGKLLGLECAGRVTAVGEEVSKLAVGDEVLAGGTYCLASHITVDARFASLKPPHMSFEQTATIPVAFCTAHYSLNTLAQMQRNERVLIHSATGGVGLAAVQLALKAGAIVFATAGTPEKRDLLRALGVPHVMDSRSLSFADEVMALTNGEGVDIILNSLSGEAIDKNLSILRSNGRFIEIGKTDIYKNRKLGMRPLGRNISIFGVDFNDAFARRADFPQSLLGEVLDPFMDGDLQPLPYRIYPAAEIADALRSMSQAKHIGKLVIAMKDTAGLEVQDVPAPVKIEADASYLITGGLGGFGLAVAERLARRGARHLVLAGRSAPSAAALATIAALRRQGVEVVICSTDITDHEQARRAVAAARGMRPLRGIIHAAMVLDDATIEHLTEERMWKAMGPKILGAWNLHALTSDETLDFFVMFSSIASIVGNPGQANYVAGNAFLDALAYYRRSRGQPALTINWGVLGEVGHVAGSAETAQRLDRLGLEPMPLSATLDALDELMSSAAVQVTAAQVDWKTLLRGAGSRIPARYAGLAGDSAAEDGRASTGSRPHDILEADEAALPSLLEAYIRDLLARAMGTSPARIDNQQSLRNLGLDSLIAVEVRNRINSDLGMNIPLAKFMQSESTLTVLAGHVAERLQESNRSERTEEVPITAGNGSGNPMTGTEAADLLERIDELSDEEVERHLSVLGAQEHS